MHVLFFESRKLCNANPFVQFSYLSERPNSCPRLTQQLPGVHTPIFVRFDAASLKVTFWVNNQGASVDLAQWIRVNAIERGLSPNGIARAQTVLEAVPYVACYPGVELRLNPTLGAMELSAMRSMDCYRMPDRNSRYSGWIKERDQH